ncbi:hypothetical protein [Bacterioplanoides sp. SCSIO 12839]|nr:hypothetical protein [Bacterioplanoides sp. SCSIO 12839]UTW47907.1 hypothetical protein KFF03_15310 [Bacterioplanoides sp. SCSIO 12839]
MELERFFPEIGYTEKQPATKEVVHVHLLCVFGALAALALVAALMA